MNYELFETTWKKLANEKKLTATHFVNRAIVKAIKAKVNAPKEDLVVYFLQKYFTPVTNRTKLANGQAKFEAIDGHKNRTRWAKAEHLIILGMKASDFLTPAEVVEYLVLARTIRTDKIGRKYVYYFVAQDMPPEHQAVQSAHVIYKLGAKLGNKANADDTYFQWIGVPSTNDLLKVIETHSTYKKVLFCEPDLGSRLTAIAFEPILWNEREEFLQYPLLSHDI